MSKDTSKDTTIDANASSADDDFAKLLVLLIRRRWWVLGGIALGLAVAGLAIWLITPIYRSTTVAFPANNKEGSGGLGSVLSQFSGMASMAGLDIGESGNPEAVAILNSRQFNERFITQNALMPILFAKDWDSSRGAWKSGIRRPKTLWDGYDYFTKKVRTVLEDRKSGLLTIHVDWKNRDLAAQWANQTIVQLNQEMRQRAIDEAAGMVIYLNKELEKADNLSLREQISKLIESEIKERAVATVRYEYAYHVIDAAEPADPRHPAKPQVRVYLVFGAIAGLILGILAALLDQSIRKSAARGSF